MANVIEKRAFTSSKSPFFPNSYLQYCLESGCEIKELSNSTFTYTLELQRSSILYRLEIKNASITIFWMMPDPLAGEVPKWKEIIRSYVPTTIEGFAHLLAAYDVLPFKKSLINNL